MKTRALLLVAALIAASCGGSSSPVSPAAGSSSNFSSVIGSWSGTSADSAGQQKLSWTLTQNGASVSGSMSVSDIARGMMGTGTMTGTMNGRNVSFHMQVPNGGFNGMMSSCSMDVDGDGMMSDDGRTMTGTYSGNMSGMMSGGMMSGGMMSQSSCGGMMSNGHFTLTR